MWFSNRKNIPTMLAPGARALISVDHHFITMGGAELQKKLL